MDTLYSNKTITKTTYNFIIATILTTMSILPTSKLCAMTLKPDSHNKYQIEQDDTLIETIEKQDLPKVILLLEGKADPNVYGSNSTTTPSLHREDPESREYYG